MRCFALNCAALLLLAASTGAQATSTFTYNGPDELLIVGRPNSAGSNTRTAELHSRTLPVGRVGEVLAPLVTSALVGCSMDDVRRIVISADPMPDRIGDTTTRIHGLGLYLNLPLANRVPIGNFYLAPFFVLTVSIVGDAGPLQTVELFEFGKTILDTPQITQEGFLDARTADVEASIVAFAKARMPSAMRKAFGSRCPVA